MNENNRNTTIFLILTFFLSWTLILGFYLAGGVLHSVSGMVIGVIFMFMPTVATLITQRYFVKEPIATALGIKLSINRWYFVGWFSPLIFSLLVFAVALLLPGVEFSTELERFSGQFEKMSDPKKLGVLKSMLKESPIQSVVLGTFSALFAGLTINAIAGFGEELGWRGFLVRQFSHLSFWRTSLLIGFIWGIWHGPLILLGHNYPMHPAIGVGMMTIFAILLSPLFLYVRLKSGSVISVAIMHGTINASSGLAVILLRGGNDLLVGVTGLAGFIVLVLLNLVLVVYDRYMSKTPILSSPSLTPHITPSNP